MNWIWIKLIIAIIFIIVPGFSLRENLERNPFITYLALLIGIGFFFLTIFTLFDNHEKIEFEDALIDPKEKFTQRENKQKIIINNEKDDINLFWKHLKYSFTREEYVNPRIVQELLGWISDSNESITQINLVEANKSNRFFAEPYVRNTVSGQWVFVNLEEGGSFGYNYIGTSPSGVHILSCVDVSTGSGMFNYIIFLGLSSDKSLNLTTSAIQTKERILLKSLGSIVLGDRYEGKVSYNNGKLFIESDQSKMRYGQRFQDEVLSIE